MNENELSTLLSRAGERLDADVSALVAGGEQRGRHLQRRRRVAGGLGVAAAVGALAVVTTLLPSGNDSPTAVDLTPAASPSPTAQGQRELADPGVIKDRLLRSLPAGDVTDIHVASVPDVDGYGRPISRTTVRLELDGAAVVVELEEWTSPAASDVAAPGPKPAECEPTRFSDSIDGRGMTRLSDLRKVKPADLPCFEWTTAQERWTCAQDDTCWAEINDRTDCVPADQDCSKLPDSTAVRSGTDDENGRPGVVRHWAIRSSNAPWDISIDALNAPKAKGAVPGAPVAPAPALNQKQLETLASSDIWFK